MSTATAFAILVALGLTAAVAAGLVLGEWLAHREARANLHRRQTLAGLDAVASVRLRHPSVPR